MIFSSLKSADPKGYYPPAIRTALNFVMTADLEGMAPGEYPIDGDRIFARVFDLTTKPVEETHPEVHEKYIDVQYWPNGSERFGIAPYLGSGTVVGGDPNDDLYFLDQVADESFVTARPGDFAVFFPWDAHRPGTVLGEPSTFRKCVVKVSVDLL